LVQTGIHLLPLLCFVFVSASQAASQIERFLPETAQGGASFTVTNQVAAAEEVLVYAVEESVPPGWGVSGISFFGALDLAQGKIKWGPFFDQEPRALTYRVTPPADLSGEAVWSGSGSFNGNTIPIVGDTSVRVNPGADIPTRNEVVSFLPRLFVPGGTVMLTNRVSLATDTIVYAVEDQAPAGWTAGFLNHGGQFDLNSGKIKWGPFLDRVARELICELKAPLTSSGSVRFEGSAAFDGILQPILGQRQIQGVVSTVVRELPEQFQLDEVIPVKLTVTPAEGATVFAVEERPPVDSGWAITEISHNGTYDAEARVIKWGPFFANTSLTLTYNATAPASPGDEVARFSGVGSFDGILAATLGRQEIAGLLSRAVRLAPVEYLPGGLLSVTNRIEPDRTVRVYAVEEQLPIGWRVSATSEGAVLDELKRKLKWGPFVDGERRELWYVLAPLGRITNTVRFDGTASFDERTVSIAGSRESQAASVAALNSVLRSMPASVRVGRSVQITNDVIAAPGVSVYAIEEQLPAGWTAGNVNHGGAFDALQGKVKWGPFFDLEPRLLTYDASPEAGASGSVAFSGVGSFNGERVSIQGISSMIAIANHAPVAREDIFERLAAGTLNISAGDLVANDSDADGDPIAITEVAALSGAGFPLSLRDGVIRYDPGTAFEPGDTFTYRITDGFGGEATGLVKIVVISEGPSGNRWRVETFPDGTIRLRFAGIPGRTYNIQATDTLRNPVWLTLETRVAGVRGDFEFHDTDALNHPTRFYRTIAP
jgi:hypothetical protein